MVGASKAPGKESMTALTRPKMFARIGTREILDAKLAEIRANVRGAEIAEDREAATVEATYGETLLVRAICKGGDLWIISYNEDFYPRS